MKQEKKKRAVSFILSLLLMVVAVLANPVMARAETVDESDVTSGICGAEGNEENVRWEYDGNGKLTISGNGAMANYDWLVTENYEKENRPPWERYYYDIKTVFIEEGITDIEAYSFSDEPLYEAFPFLQRVYLPGTLTRIDRNSFGQEVGDSDYLQGIYGRTDCAKNFALAIGIPYIDLQKTYDMENSIVDMPVERFAYTGTEIRPELSVSYKMEADRVLLTEGIDYQLDYFDNVEIGQATVRITGIGCYEGSKELKFSIRETMPLDENFKVSFYRGTTWYEDSESKRKVEVSFQGSNLLEGTDYTVSYEILGIMDYYWNDGQNPAGRYPSLRVRATVTGIGRYTGTLTTEQYYRTNKKDLEKCEINLEYERVQYDGTEKRPQVTIISPSGDVLKENIDYTLEYETNADIIVFPFGSTVTIIGMGDYVGKLYKVFWIDAPDKISGTCGAEGNGENVRWKYDGNGILTLSGTGAVASNALAERILPEINRMSLSPIFSFRNIRVGEGITRLKTNSLVYYGTTKIELPSTITEIEKNALLSAVLYGKSDYAREYAEKWEISYVDATKTYDLSDAWFYIPSYEYTGSEIRPVPGESTADMYGRAPFVRYNGVILYQGLDYSIAYENNIECGEAKAVLTGLGNYTGTKETSFSICEELITVGTSDVKITYENMPESYEEAVDANPKTIVTYKGKTLTEGVDYVVNIEREYISGLEEGEPDVLWMNISVYGKGLYGIMYERDVNIWRQSINNTHVSLEYDRIPYDGSPKKPNVTVTTLKGKLLEETTDYILDYVDNVNPGKATVKIIGKGAYRGTDREAVFHIDGLSINGAAISLDEAIFTYDGSPKRPSVKVTLNGKLLTVGNDYSVSYSGNINPGTAYVTVTGNGIYAGSVRKSFKILPYSSGKDSVYDKENTFIDGDYIYEVTDDEQKEVELIGTANKNLTKAAVPLEAVGNGTKYKVTSIGEKAFYKNAKLKSVTVASNVTSIENYAFYGCKNVTSIKLGKNVELIGDSSFRKCAKLKSVTLPKKMEELGKNAFYDCKKLKTITIQANGVVSIGKNALKGISKTAVIKVPAKQVKKYQKQVKANTGFKKSMKIKKK